MKRTEWMWAKVRQWSWGCSEVSIHQAQSLSRGPPTHTRQVPTTIHRTEDLSLLLLHNKLARSFSLLLLIRMMKTWRLVMRVFWLILLCLHLLNVVDQSINQTVKEGDDWMSSGREVQRTDAATDVSKVSARLETWEYKGIYQLLGKYQELSKIFRNYEEKILSGKLFNLHTWGYTSVVACRSIKRTQANPLYLSENLMS